MTIAAAQLREWIERRWPATPISRFACRDTAGGQISQHSAYGSPRPSWSTKTDSNALDVFGPGKTSNPSDQAWIQEIVDAIQADGEHKWSIRKIIWRDGGAHENHAHIDFYPMITMSKWCGGPETPTWRYSNRSTIKTRDPQPENGEYHGPDEDEDMLKPGDSGINVAKWQTYINRWITAYKLPMNPLDNDGVFGPITDEYTKVFQGWSNIEETGTVGYFDAATMAVAIGPDTDAP